MIKPVALVIGKFNKYLAMLPETVVGLLARFAIASVFWRSAQTKIEGWSLFGQNWKFWNVTDGTLFLFEYE